MLLRVVFKFLILTEDFVRSMSFGTEGRLECVLFSDQQFKDILRFCTSEKNFSIINIDTTFNLGRFYVTYLTYRNISLYLKDADKHPVFIGPVLLHLRRDKISYLSLANELKKYATSKNIDLSSVKCIVTDDDRGLRSAMKTVFKKASFMLCCNHLRKDFIKILNRYSVDHEDQNEILAGIFGNKNERQASLIGSENKKEFEHRAKTILKNLKEHEHSIWKLDLSDWFKKHMLLKIYNSFWEIVKANKSIVNDYYTTNDIEGKNKNRCKLFLILFIQKEQIINSKS